MANITGYTQARTDVLLAAKANQSDVTALQTSVANNTAATQANASNIGAHTASINAVNALMAGYQAQTLSGATTLAVTAGTYDLTVAADSALTLTASNGTTVTLVVRPATGKTLTIQGVATVGSTATGFAITTAGVYTLMRLPEGWVMGSGSSATATTGASSAASSTTSASTATLVGSIDFTKATVGASGAGLVLSPSTAAIAQNGSNAKINATYGLAVVSTGGTMYDQFSAPVRLAREQVTGDYVMTSAGDGNNMVNIGVGANSDTTTSLWFQIRSDGTVTGQFNENYPGTLTVKAGYSAPASGTAVYLWDQSTLTATLAINGTQVATWVGNAAGNNAWGTKCGGPMLAVQAWDQKTTGWKNLKVEAV